MQLPRFLLWDILEPLVKRYGFAAVFDATLDIENWRNDEKRSRRDAAILGWRKRRTAKPRPRAELARQLPENVVELRPR